MVVCDQNTILKEKTLIKIGGAVTNSQQFNFTGGAGPLILTPLNAVGTCLAVTPANVLDQTPCNGDATQEFTFGGSSGSSAPASSAATTPSEVPVSSTALQAEATSSQAACTSTMVTVTRAASSTSAPVAASIIEVAASSSPSSSAIIAATSAVAVSGADA